MVLSSSIGTGLSYVWKKDGAVFTPAVVGKNAISINSDGVYTVDVVIDAKSCSTSSNKFVAKFNPTPIVDPIMGSASICSGANTTLSAGTKTPNPIYEWYDKGILIGKLPTLAVADSGRYQVQVTERTSNCRSLNSSVF